jgi:flavin-dependent dehydrogenase
VQPVSCDARGARINACALVQANAAKTIDDVLQQHPSLAQRSRNWMAAIQAVSTFPLLFHPAEPVHNSMLQTGDAAAFVDPFVGDGISLALRSGKLATDCLLPYLRGECSLSCACACYAREYGRRLGHVLQASSKLRRVLAWPVLIRRPLLSVASRAPFITAQLVRMTR